MYTGKNLFVWFSIELIYRTWRGHTSDANALPAGGLMHYKKRKLKIPLKMFKSIATSLTLKTVNMTPLNSVLFKYFVNGYSNTTFNAYFKQIFSEYIYHIKIFISNTSKNG